jgi:hypothetical protein
MTSKEELIAKAQALAQEKGTTRLGIAEFRLRTGTRSQFIYRHFGGWAGLCAAAGLEPLGRTTRIPDDRLFAAMREAFLACGGIVPRGTFELRFAYSPHVLTRRFGNWTQALAAFAAWAKENAPDFPFSEPLLRYLDERALRPPSGKTWQSIGARTSGERVGFRALAHAPINELGVILAFGMVAEELGYSIESVAADFPDCTGRRRIADGRWEDVRIEFEYRSNNFRRHGHVRDGCDVIVCWEHDWQGCPLEVLELKSAIAILGGKPGAAPPLGTA